LEVLGMRTTLVTLTVGFALVMACGGDTATPTIPLVDGGNTADSASNVDGGNQPDSSVNPDASVNPDGSTNLDGSTGTDGSSSVITTLACGKQTCALPSESCCVDITGNNPVLTCTGGDAGGSCGQGLVELQCKSSADCSGNNVCCLDATVDPANATCSPACGGTDMAILCDPKGSVQSNKCGDAGTCGNKNIDTWGLTNQYGTCGDTSGPL
jgi:hypothetical protein